MRVDLETLLAHLRKSDDPMAQQAELELAARQKALRDIAYNLNGCDTSTTKSQAAEAVL